MAKKEEMETQKQAAKPVHYVLVETEESKKNGAIPVFTIKDTEAKQVGVNLETGNEDAEIKVIQRKIIPTDGVPVDVQLQFAQRMVTPAEKQVAALLDFSQREAYRESKEKAIRENPNFLTSAVKSRLVELTKSLPKYADLKRDDAFAAWLEGYKAKRPKAVEYLATAKMLAGLSESDEGF